jgi:hypothetical protein
MAGHDLTDTYIPYGRGGAGNMRKSSISITNNAFHHTSDYPHLMPSCPYPTLISFQQHRPQIRHPRRLVQNNIPAQHASSNPDFESQRTLRSLKIRAAATQHKQQYVEQQHGGGRAPLIMEAVALAAATEFGRGSGRGRWQGGRD